MSHIAAVRITTIGLAVATAVLAALGQQKYQSFDPGHKAFVDVGSTRVSCPNGFAPVGEGASSDHMVFRHGMFKLALFVVVERDESTHATLGRWAGPILKEGVSEDAGGYRWKDLPDYAKQSAFETAGGMIQGYNGTTRLGLEYRELRVGGKRFLVGYVFDFHGGPEAKRLFDENAGGDSLLGAVAETHVICSITGEKYDDLNPNDGGLGHTPAH